MTYQLNDPGIKELKRRRKENNKLFFIFPFISIIYLILTYISMRGSTFFWITAPVLLTLFMFIGVVSPIIAANRFNRVITNLKIENDQNITIQTDNVNFKKGKIIKLKLSDIKLINERRIAYGSGLDNGLLIRLKTNQDFYLIEKFYDNFNDIKTDLKTN